MSRFKAVAGAALVLGLLVLPPAISTGQDPAPADPDQATADDPDDPFSQPAGGGQATGSGSGTQAGGGTQAGSGAGNDPSATEAPPDPAIEVQQTSTSSTSAGARKQAAARFASSLTVSIGDNFYSPKSISVSAGDTVTWTNNGKASHTATATDGSFDTGTISPGQSRSHTFSQPGTFNYFCQIHGTVQSGTVTVASAGGGGGGTSEAAAVASSGAAGDSSTLPLTGTSTLIPLGVGLLLLVAGLGLRLRDWVGSA
jgi:plastocyanin